jgi:hypothetical protein
MFDAFLLLFRHPATTAKEAEDGNEYTLALV